MNPYIVMWILMFVIALIIELFTSAFVCVWFLPSAVICMILAIFGVPVFVQYIVFFGLSVLLLFLLRKPFLKRMKRRKNLSEYDSDDNT